MSSMVRTLLLGISENRLTAQRGLVLYFGGVAQEALDEIKGQKEELNA